MNHVIFYHKEDNDGVFSGALIKDFLIKRNFALEHEITAIGLDYNDIDKITRKQLKELREVYDVLFITDLSLPIKLMEYCYKLWGSSFHWFDHHAPIIQASLHSHKNLFECKGERNTDRSAILNVWKYLYDPLDIIYNEEHDKIPKYLDILSAWDSWTYLQNGYELDYVRKVNKGFTHIFNLNFEEVYHTIKLYDDRDWNNFIEKAFVTGTILVTAENNQLANIIRNDGDCNWKLIDKDGNEHSACAIFMQGATNSQMFDTVKDKVDCGIVFKRKNNGKWVISLYNTKEESDFHCGEFCREKYKGGGHKGAAGCQVKQSTFIKMLKSKTI